MGVPGAAPATSFGTTARAQIAANGGFPDAYAGFVEQTMAGMQRHAAGGEVTTPQDVAAAVFRAATDPDCPTILPAGADAIAWSKGH